MTRPGFAFDRAHPAGGTARGGAQGVFGPGVSLGIAAAARGAAGAGGLPAPHHGAAAQSHGAFLHYRHREALYPSLVFRAAHDRLVADHGERPGILEYLQVLQLAAEKTVAAVEPVLQAHLAGAGKWRALQVRAQLVPATEKVIALAELTPRLAAYNECR